MAYLTYADLDEYALRAAFRRGFEKAADLLPGGKGDDKPDSAFKKDELKEGIKHEGEHTKNLAIRKEIAKDHLTEDRDYYKHLDEAKLAFYRGFEKAASAEPGLVGEWAREGKEVQDELELEEKEKPKVGPRELAEDHGGTPWFRSWP